MEALPISPTKANAQPATAPVSVGLGELFQALLRENTLRLDRTWPGPNALTPLWNGMRGGWHAATGAVRSFRTKLSGRPGAYEGLWELVLRTYDALQNGGPPPIGRDQIDAANRLVGDMLAGLEAT